MNRLISASFDSGCAFYF